jgi:hypothetical protein
MPGLVGEILLMIMSTQWVEDTMVKFCSFLQMESLLSVLQDLKPA